MNLTRSTCHKHNILSLPRAQSFMHWLISALLALATLMLSFGVRAETVSAETLYRDLQARIFQIQVIDLASNKKSSIGSGFLVSADGLIATNYHVIAEFIHAPGRYRIEYLDHAGGRGELKLRNIDVIHDLAIVSASVDSRRLLPLSSRSLSKGAHIYAIGNPHDLGMSIIEGTFNGLLEKSQYQKILFSGSLNPGMSGGPALDEDGRVIGVNVSTAGNDLSFLVPVKYLRRLLARQQADAPVTDFMALIEQQLLDNQAEFVGQIMQAEWNRLQLGKAQLPAELKDYFKCWGQSDNDEDRLYEHTYSACASPDSIYISSHFNTGNVDFRYDWFEADKLNRFQFYSMYSAKFAASYSTNNAGREDVGNYQCKTEFVTLNQRDVKMALCVRQYKKFNRLYDLSLTLASLDSNNQGLVINMNAAGISRQNALAFSRRYLEAIEWTD